MTYVLASVLVLTITAQGFTVSKYMKIPKDMPEKEKISNDNPSAKTISNIIQVLKNIWP